MDNDPDRPRGARGSLRVLLGAAPGVGKTYAMLGEGRRRAARGTDVVVAFVETHGREQTAAQLDGLEVLPRKEITHRGATFTEMDVDAVLARRPDVALVDELAHTNVPGSRNARRADDVEELLAAGIDVITTVNVQHLESLNDVVEQVTGIVQRETVPDAVVRAADQVELVDMAPEALRRRMQHGNIYAPEKVDAALRNYFRPGNLAALRELALLWLADRVDAGLADYRRHQEIDATWHMRDRVVVALSGGPEGAGLLRRGARIALKGVGGELHAVYVARTDGLVSTDREALTAQRKLVDDLSGTFHALSGDDPAEVVLEFARSINATHVVVGTTRSSRWQRLFREPMDRRIVNASGDIDVHLVSHDWAATGRHRSRTPLTARRRMLGAALSVVLPVLLTVALSRIGGANESLALMAYLAVAVLVALVGGMVPALVAAVVGSLLVNWYFTPPVHTLTIADPTSVLALVVSLVVAAATALVVDRAASLARSAVAARSEADTLYLLTEQTLGTQLGDADALDLVRETFGQDLVQLRARDTVTSPWRILAASGEATAGEPDTFTNLDEHLQFACAGPALTASQERVLTSFGHQFLARRERDALRARARQVAELEARDGLQTALLAAVSHDLRTPLAAIKVASSSLLATDIEWPAAERQGFVAMIDENADRLSRLIGNLLDMTRLRTGHLSVARDEVIVDELLRPSAAADPGRVEVRIEPGLPLLRTDAGLAERVVGNLVDNALRHQPADRPVVVSAVREGDGVTIRVADNGPGVAPERREAMFKPFQRVGDAPDGTGLGLGLAVAQGFTQALSATLVASDTPGGGLTMALTLPLTDPEEDHG